MNLLNAKLGTGLWRGQEEISRLQARALTRPVRRAVTVAEFSTAGNSLAARFVQAHWRPWPSKLRAEGARCARKPV
jgi:hypothetical protein